MPKGLPPAEPGEMFDPLRCVLQAGHPGEHYALARSLPLKCPGEVWGCWVSGRQPSRMSRLPDCPARSPDACADACLLPNGHVGVHSWSLSDPEEDELRARLGLF